MELRKTLLIGTIAGLICISLVGTVVGEVYVISGNWETETVDTESGKDYGWWPSVGLDANGSIAVIHGDDDWYKLRYTHWNGTGWETEYISENYSAGMTGDGYDLQAAWDSNGTAHATHAYYTGSNDIISHTYWNGSGWETENVTDVGWVYDVAIAIDSNDYSHIIYVDNHYDYVGGAFVYGLIYAAWNGTGWDIETIAASNVSLAYAYPSITIDSNDNPHISYSKGYNEGELWYGKKVGSWSLESVITDRRCLMSDIVLDSGDNPYIAFSDYTNDWLGYVEKTDGSWSETYLNCNDAFTPSIILDEYNRPFISYTSDAPWETKLYYAIYDGYNWYGEVLDYAEEPLWYYTSLGSDIIVHNETVHIFYQYYFSSGDASLKHTKYNLTRGEWSYSKGIYGNIYLLPLYSAGKDTDITCKNNTFNTSTIANNTGYYIFDNLDTGNYWINASLYNYIDNSAIVEIVSGYNQILLNGCDAL